MKQDVRDNWMLLNNNPELTLVGTDLNEFENKDFKYCFCQNRTLQS